LQDKGGCKVSIKGTDTIKVYNVKANATIVGSVSCELNPVEFTDSSVSADNIVHHYWYFGDGTTADQKTITHRYSDQGNYDAYLVAVTALGCTDTFHFAAPVQVLPKPDISIVGDDVVCANAPAEFVGISTTFDSTIKWNWDLGNGKTFSGQDAAATYNNKGSYTINLVASNSGGCSDTTAKTISVNPKPTINAGLDSTVCQGSAYQLNASGGVTYTWSGVGLSCTDCASPTIKPDSVSTYVVTGKDAAGCSNEDAVTISVVTPGKITVSGNDTLCIGENAKLSASGATSYQWYPSAYLDNDKSPDPVFTAATDTSITYKVVGQTAKNCFADTGYVSVKTYPIPKMDILRDEIVLNVGASVQLHTNSSADITTWHWSPPQGLSNTVVADPVASPEQSTTYSVIASNGGSCVARDQITINVICSGSNVFIPNTFSPNNDGMNDVFYPRGTGLFKIKSFRVFNRWGQVVFEKTNTTPNNATEGWDGKINGKPVNADVYVYIIEVLCSNNMVIPFKGNITLIR
jgi:gliding motility-associated-like protein